MSITLEGDRVHIDFAAIRAIAAKAVARASGFLGFSINAVESELSDFHPRGAYIHFLPEQMSPEQVSAHKSAYRKWAVQNSLRELVEGFGNFLNALYVALSFATHLNQEPFLDIQKRCLDFEQASEAKRLRRLKTEFGIQFALYDHVRSFIQVRNTVTHRWGRVLTDEVVVRWRAMEAFVRADDGTDQHLALPITEPVLVTKEGDLAVRIVERSKRFMPGTQIEFEPSEVHEICQTLDDAVRQIMSAVARALPANLKVENKLSQ